MGDWFGDWLQSFGKTVWKTKWNEEHRKDIEANLITLREALQTKTEEGQSRGGAESFVDDIGNGVTSGEHERIAVALQRFPQIVFVLRAVEDIPEFGELFGFAADVTTTGASVATDGFQAMMGNVPFIGPGINALVGLFVWPILAVISLSRKQFSQSIEEFLKAIPLGLGQAMSRAFSKTDKLAGKTAGRWEHLKKQFAAAWDRAQNASNVRIEDAYAILGVPPTATRDEIRAAYRNLALHAHPDKGGNLEEFNKIKAAYETIIPPPTGGKRKRLSTRKRGKKNTKWTKTRRTKSAKR